MSIWKSWYSYYRRLMECIYYSLGLYIQAYSSLFPDKTEISYRYDITLENVDTDTVETPVEWSFHIYKKSTCSLKFANWKTYYMYKKIKNQK